MHAVDRVTLARLPSGVRVETAVHRYGRGATLADAPDDSGTGTAPDPAALAATDGPLVYVQAAQHGREVNGVEVCRRLHDRLCALDPDDVRGTLVVVPLVDPLTFDRVSYTTPEAIDSMRPNMNRAWPGDPGGSVHGRIAARLWPYATAADACVDLHTGSPKLLTHTVYLRGHDDARALAEAFGVPFLMGETAGGDADDEWHDRGFAGKFRVAATREGVPTITPELADSRRIDESAVAAGVEGVLGVARHTGVLAPGTDTDTDTDGPAGGAGDGDADDGPAFRYARNHIGRVRAAEPGLFVPADGLELGATVEAGDVVGTVYDPTTYEERQVARADRAGVVYAITREATVGAGGALVGVAVPLPEDER
jgi:predicted deacylase